MPENIAVSSNDSDEAEKQSGFSAPPSDSALISDTSTDSVTASDAVDGSQQKAATDGVSEAAPSDGTVEGEGAAPSGEADAKPAPEAPHGIRAAASGQRAKKTDSGAIQLPVDVQLTVVQKARAVFVPSVHYLLQIDTFTSDQRIWIVTGRPQSGKFTCALHLGLALLRQGRPLNRDLYGSQGGSGAERRPEDYAHGIRLLRQRITDRMGARERILEQDALTELATLEARLFDNLNSMQQSSDNENLRSDRYQVLAQLNARSIDLFSMNFYDLCRWSETQDTALERAPFLQSLPAVKIIRRGLRDGFSLPDLLQEQNIERQTIYILERAFEQGMHQSELSGVLQASLSSKDSYLIITTELTEQSLSTLSLPRISTRFAGAAAEFQTFLRNVLGSHLDYYEAIDGLPENLRLKVEGASDQILLNALRQPFTIDMFCARLRGLPPDANIEAISKLADQVGRIDYEATRSWFRALSENDRLYALLAYLFTGVERYLLDDLYTLSVQYLRKDGVERLFDPRGLGLGDIRDHVRAHVTESNTIQFNNPALEEEVRRQVGNYHHILWSLCEHVFAPFIVEFRASSYGALRQSLGASIGRMGVYHLVKLEPLLDGLAAHESGGVAATAGYILDALVRTDPARCGWSVERLERWSRSQDPDLMWAASAAVWRIYDAVADIAHSDDATSPTVRLAADALERLRAILTELASHPDRFRDEARARATRQAEEVVRGAISDAPEGNQTEQTRTEAGRQRMQQELVRVQIQQWTAMLVEGVSYALLQLSRKHAVDIITLLSQWLQEPPNSNQHVVGELAVQHLFAETIAAREQGSSAGRLILDRHEPLLGLVGPMLGADTDTLRDILQTLRHWINQTGWDERVQRALVGTIAQAKDADRIRLVELITDEWVGPDEAVSRIAHSLVARARMIDGFPVDVYDGNPTLVLVDSTRPARRQRDIGARLARLVAIELAAITPTTIGALGFAQPRIEQVGVTSTSSILAPTLASRLLVPVLERCTGPKTPLALALTWGPILDVEDCLDGPWAKRLLVAELSPQQDLLQGIDCVQVSQGASLRTAADQFIDKALIRLFQGFAARDASAWWVRIGPLLHLESPDLDAIDACIDRWTADLDAPPRGSATDPLRAVVTTMCWMATANLPACVERLIRWMASEDARHQLVGKAVGRAMFYLFGSMSPAPMVDTHSELLQLVAPLSKQGWASVRAILFAARRWARAQSWAERLISPPDGESAEILRLVDALSADDRSQLTQFLTTWVHPLEGDDPDATPARITRLAEQIKLRLVLGTRKPLPSLVEGQSYGILMVDTSVSRAPQRRILAQIASLAVREIRRRYGSTVQLLTYRLGQDYPLAGPSEQPGAAVIAPHDGAFPPRLLGPILDRLTPDQVRFVVLLSTAPAHDEEDWYETSWANHIHVYNHTNRSVQPFKAIPPQSTVKNGAEAIAEYLATQYPQG